MNQQWSRLVLGIILTTLTLNSALCSPEENEEWLLFTLQDFYFKKENHDGSPLQKTVEGKVLGTGPKGVRLLTRNGIKRLLWRELTPISADLAGSESGHFKIIDRRIISSDKQDLKIFLVSQRQQDDSVLYSTHWENRHKKKKMSLTNYKSSGIDLANNRRPKFINNTSVYGPRYEIHAFIDLYNSDYLEHVVILKDFSGNWRPSVVKDLYEFQTLAPEPSTALPDLPSAHPGLTLLWQDKQYKYYHSERFRRIYTKEDVPKLRELWKKNENSFEKLQLSSSLIKAGDNPEQHLTYIRDCITAKNPHSKFPFSRMKAIKELPWIEGHAKEFIPILFDYATTETNQQLLRKNRAYAIPECRTLILMAPLSAGPVATAMNKSSAHFNLGLYILPAMGSEAAPALPILKSALKTSTKAQQHQLEKLISQIKDTQNESQKEIDKRRKILHDRM